MPTSPLTAFEHEVLSAHGGAGGLSSADVERLVQLGTLRPGFCTLGHGSVRLAQFAGLVRLNGRILEILPKLGEARDVAGSRSTLLRLLALAHGLRLTTDASVGHDLTRQTLLDVFIAAFLDEVSRLVRGGLLRRYQPQVEDLPLLRGRLDIGRQATALAMRPDRLACRFDELTADNPWNQRLKAALLVARSWITQLETARRWMETASAFDEVRALAVELPSGRAALDRQAHRYSAALGWANWILQLLSPNLRAGDSTAPELLFDMNKLFEKAVASVLGKRARERGLRLSVQDTGHHLATSSDAKASKHFRLRPDLVLHDASGPVAVGDTKWSRVDYGEGGRLVPAEAHAYQLNAYASVYPCTEFTLIHPYALGAPVPHASSFRLPVHGGKQATLHVLSIDVSRDALPLVGSAGESLIGELLRKNPADY